MPKYLNPPDHPIKTSSPPPLNEENNISFDVITLTAENNNLKRMSSLLQQLMQEQTDSLAAKDNKLDDLNSKRHMVVAQNQELKRANDKLEATIVELRKQLSTDDDDDYPPLQQLKLCDAEQQTLLETANNTK
ncbi:hypothetical protein KR009_005210 [Drosophila setifemur]|nr:hypothetical protein KR009_005210 [Drosophila setifemur]